MNLDHGNDLRMPHAKSLFRTIAEIIASFLFIALSLWIARGSPSWLVRAACFLIISSRQYSLLLLMHDGIHGSLCRSKRLNDFLGEYVLSYPVGALFFVGRERHSAHHQHFATDIDPDRKFYMRAQDDGSRPFSHLRRIIVFLALNYKGLFAEEAGTASKMILYHAALFAGLYLWTGQWSFYFLFWFLPIINFVFVFDKFRLFCEHTPDPNLGDGRIVTRHFRSNWVERFFLAPYHVNFHVAHHLSPGTSHRELPKIAKQLAPYGDSRNYISENSYIGFFIRAFIVKKPQPVGG